MNQNGGDRHAPARVIVNRFHERIFLHYALLTRQMAKLSDSLLHIVRERVRSNDDPRRVGAYAAYAQTELADIAQEVREICSVLGLSFTETVEMGSRRKREKQEEFERKYPNEPFI